MQIDNPTKKGYKILHSYVDCGSRGESIYKYRIKTLGKQGNIEMPEYVKSMNNNFIVLVSASDVLGYGRGIVDNNILRIFVQNDGIYDVLVVGTRSDNIGKRLFDKLGAEFKSDL